MFWNTVFTVLKSQGDSIVFEGKGPNLIRCIESSDLKIVGGNSYSNSFVVSGLEKKKDQLIVVKATIINGKNGSFIANQSFFINIEDCFSKQADFLVNDKRNWAMFPNGRLGSIEKNGCIELRIDDEIFSTNPDVGDGAYFIGEKNACCNYLTGKIDATAVLASAKKTEEKISLSAKCQQLEDELKKSKTIAKDYLQDCVNSGKTITGLRKILAATEKDRHAWETIACNLRSAVKIPMFFGRFVHSCNRGKRGPMWIFRETEIVKTLKTFPDVVEGISK